MSRANFFRASVLFVGPILLAACNTPDFGKVKPDFSQIKKVPIAILNIGKSFDSSTRDDTANAAMDTSLPLKDILGGSLADKNRGTDFISSIKYALDTDPEIVSKRREIKVKLASVGATKARKDFQVGTTLYGGIEDVTDNTKGIALAFNASRLVFDGGKLDSEIASSLFEVEASKWTWLQQ